MGEGPLVLHTLDELIDMTYLKLDTGLFRPAVVDAFQEVIEEALLEQPPVVGVEMGPMLDSVYLEPFLLRDGTYETLKVPPRV